MIRVFRWEMTNVFQIERSDRFTHGSLQLNSISTSRFIYFYQITDSNVPLIFVHYIIARLLRSSWYAKGGRSIDVR